MNKWNSKQLANWILKYGKRHGKTKTFAKYAIIILDEKITGKLFLTMGVDEFTELGFKTNHAQTLLNLARGYA